MSSLPSSDRMDQWLRSLYCHLQSVHRRNRHIKIFHYMLRQYSVLVWAGTGFECYTVAEGSVSRGVMARGARGVVRGARSEEARLFVTTSRAEGYSILYRIH
jgi:hypothetical protein